MAKCRVVNNRLAVKHVKALCVGGGIPDAPFACSTVIRGVKDAAPYAQAFDVFYC